jgi:hypothetical protein
MQQFGNTGNLQNATGPTLQAEAPTTEDDVGTTPTEGEEEE